MNIRVQEAIVAIFRHLARQGVTEAHGFLVAKELMILGQGRHMIGYGTLYRSLYQLEKKGVIRTRWEELPEGETRPRRRYYSLVAEDGK